MQKSSKIFRRYNPKPGSGLQRQYHFQRNFKESPSKKSVKTSPGLPFYSLLTLTRMSSGQLSLQETTETYIAPTQTYMMKIFLSQYLPLLTCNYFYKRTQSLMFGTRQLFVTASICDIIYSSKEFALDLILLFSGSRKDLSTESSIEKKFISL